MYKPDPRSCIRRCAYHDSQILHLLADISARLTLKNSRAWFVGTREEDKNQINIRDGVFPACEDPL